MAKVTVNSSKAFAKLNKEVRRIKKAGTATVQELVDIGKSYAKQYVPKHTRQTYEAIKGRVKPQADGTKGAVFIEMKQRSGDTRTTHDVAKFMAEGKPTPGHYKTGNPKFMANTRLYLNRIKKQIGNKNIKKGNSSVGGSV